MSAVTLVVTPEEFAGPVVVVRDDAYRHLFRARRLAAGERIRLVDGRGAAAWTRIERISSSEARLAVEGPAPTNEPRLQLEIWAGVPRPQRASWMVEKATELGVTAVRWLDSGRSGRSPRSASIERLRRVARGAVEQCQRSRIPEITGPHGWDEVWRRQADVDAAWVLDPSAPAGLGHPAGHSWLLLVGPEGGFDGAERAELDARGVRPLGMGSRILRVETAAVAGAALLLCSEASQKRCDEPV